MVVGQQRETPPTDTDTLEVFLTQCLRPALLLIVVWIEKRYNLPPRRAERNALDRYTGQR